MKRKKTPPSQFLLDRLNNIEGRTKEEARRQIQACLSDIRYVGDIKQIAEGYGLHYLKSKRMRAVELRQWIINNHPMIKGFVSVLEPSPVLSRQQRYRVAVSLIDGWLADESGYDESVWPELEIERQPGDHPEITWNNRSTEKR